VDRSTFLSKIKGPINIGAMSTRSGAYKWWLMFGSTAVFSSTDNPADGSTIAIFKLDKENPPPLSNIQFKEKGKVVETIQDSFANQALAQLPYKSTTPPATSSICNWIAAKGGKTNIKMFDVLDVIGAYKGMKSIGFTPKTFDVVGVLAYYKGKISDGDTFITC